MKKFYFSSFLKRFFFLTLLLSCAQVHAQNLIRLSVQFKKNKYVLTDEAKSILEKINDTIGDFVLDRIIVKGYTDSDADSTYNAELSLSRCQSVKTFLVQEGIDSTKISTAAFGEYFPLVENSNENNKSKNRRVDLLITIHFPVIVKKIQEKKDSCSGDTLIECSYGVMVLMNKCAYLKKDSCIRITLERHVIQKVKVNRFKMKLGFRKYTKTKNKSIIYYAHVQCPDSSCSNKNITLYVPAYEVKEKTVSVQTYDTATGKFIKYKAPKIKSFKKKTYATIPYRCGDGGAGGSSFIIPCGQPPPSCGCKPVKMKFKNGIKVIQALSYAGSETNISNDGSTVFFSADFGLSTLLLKIGTDTVRINGVEITALKHGLIHLKDCHQKKWFLLVKIHPKCSYYRKYKFKRKDIELQTEKPWEETNK